MKSKYYLLNEANIVNIEYDSKFYSIEEGLNILTDDAQHNVKKWAHKQLKKWIINNIDETIPDVFNFNNINDTTKNYYLKKYPWIQKALNKGEKLLFIRFYGITNTLFEKFKNVNFGEYSHFSDFLNSIPEDEKLDRVSISQMVQKYEKWNEDLKKQKIKAAEDGVKTVYDFKNGFKFVEVFGEESLKREGEAMGHCVGCSNYYEASQNGKLIIYSLRDKKNESHCTIEWRLKELVIQQIKGKQNKEVADKYVPYVVEFINNYKAFTKLININDIDNLDVVVLGTKLMTVEDFENYKGEKIKTKSIDLDKKNISKLPNNIETETLYISNTNIKIIPEQFKIKRSVYANNSKLEIIEGQNRKFSSDVYVAFTKIKDLPNGIQSASAIDVCGTPFEKRFKTQYKLVKHLKEKNIECKEIHTFLKDTSEKTKDNLLHKKIGNIVYVNNHK